MLAGLAGPARAGKMSWLDDVVQEVIVEAKAGGKGLAREIGGDGARLEARRAGRLFLTHDADEGLEHLVRQSEELARAGRRVEQPAEALLQSRFSRLMRQDPQALRTFAALAPAEKRLVVELGETAQLLARRYPAEAETMVRRLGPEGLTAVRVYGDDVAEVLAKEGTESIGVLRRSGRAGWSFFTEQVLPHKKKLARRRASWPRSWPTRRSSSTTPARPPSSPSRSSPRPASSSPRPSPAAPPAGWRTPSERRSPPTGSTSPCSATSAWDWPGWSWCCRSW